MHTRRSLIGLSLASLFAANSARAGTDKFRSYAGPPITQVQVHKARRKLFLISDQSVVKTYRVALGYNPVGPKKWEGDGRTPEGTYLIDWQNPNSAYHLSLRISYPNAQDLAEAAAMGRRPGGEIYIHGYGGRRINRHVDWTAGCIAVKDSEIEEIYAMVRPGTPIFLFA
jgi:murein L,D-transpeptidase YafK